MRVHSGSMVSDSCSDSHIFLFVSAPPHLHILLQAARRRSSSKSRHGAGQADSEFAMGYEAGTRRSSRAGSHTKKSYACDDGGGDEEDD